MMNIIHVGKGVYLNVEEIAYCCSPQQAPGDIVLKATDLSGGTRRCLVVTKNKINILVDITGETLLRRIQRSMKGLDD